MADFPEDEIDDVADLDDSETADIEPDVEDEAGDEGDDEDEDEEEGGVNMDPITFTELSRPIDPNLPKNYYFDNNYVEKLLTEYVKGGCTDIRLRNEIMENASELIRQIIRTHKLHLLGNGREGAAFGDLYQLAWMQIESSLYKFDYRPGHTKVFNMWSQVAKTVMLAHIKKESRDKRNYGAYKEHLDSRHRPSNYKLERFLVEAKEVCKFNVAHASIIEALESLINEDPRPYDGLIDKLVKRSGMPRAKVSGFLRTVRLRSFEFTDAPLNDKLCKPENKHRVVNGNYEADED